MAKTKITVREMRNDTVTSGYSIVADGTDGYFHSLISGGGGGGASTLDELTDVVITSVADDEVLAYDAGGDWINQTPAEAGLAESVHTHIETDITDLDHDAVSIRGVDVVDWTPSASGEVLVYDGNVYAPGTVSGGGGSGSTTFLDLTDVDETSYTGHEGYSVVVNSEEDGLEFVNVSGGGGGGAADCTVWLPDVPPASGYSTVSTSDDEFDDASFDTSLWTEFDYGATQTVAEDEWGLTLSTSTTDKFQGIVQAVPSGITNWSLTSYVGQHHNQANDELAGILLIDDITNLDTSNVFIWGSFRGGAGYGWRWAKATDYTGTLYSDGSWINDNKDFTYYVRFRTNGTTWYFDMSTDGYNWVHNAYTQAAEFTPQGVGLGHRINQTDWKGNFKFARFKNDSSYDQMLHGDRVNMWRA